MKRAACVAVLTASLAGCGLAHFDSAAEFEQYLRTRGLDRASLQQSVAMLEGAGLRDERRPEHTHCQRQTTGFVCSQKQAVILTRGADAAAVPAWRVMRAGNVSTADLPVVCL